MAEKNQKTAAKAKKSKDPKPPPVMKPRLPHGSHFDARYDGEKVLWAVTLTVPGFPPVTLYGRGLFGTLAKLDKLYRKAVEAAAKDDD